MVLLMDAVVDDHHQHVLYSTVLKINTPHVLAVGMDTILQTQAKIEKKKTENKRVVFDTNIDRFCENKSIKNREIDTSKIIYKKSSCQ